MNDNGQLTADLVIRQYIALRDKAEAIEKAANAEMKPYDDAMKVLEGWLQEQMTAMGASQIKTPEGTAYRSTIRTVKLTDPDKFETFLRDSGEWQLASIRPSKSDIATYVEEHRGETPPGIETGALVKLVVRRP